MYILFDIGGTSMRFAVSRDGKTLGEPIIEDTPQDFEKAMEVIAGIFKRLSGEERIEGVAGGIAGVFNSDGKSLFRSPHLEGWEGRPLAAELERMTGTPVFIKNDTDMIGLGEAVIGAGKGKKIVAYITVSTGVGGTRIVDGKIDEYTYGFEPGHQIIDKEQIRPFEDIVSGSAIQEKYGKLPSTIDDPELWDREAREMAVGLWNSILHWSPEVVVLGGAMMLMTPGIDIKNIKKYLTIIAKQIKILPELPEIKLVELGHLGGLHGSLIYLKSQNKL